MFYFPVDNLKNTGLSRHCTYFSVVWNNIWYFGYPKQRLDLSK